MKKSMLALTIASVLLSSLLVANIAHANVNSDDDGQQTPLVSCDWLASHSQLKSLVIIDIRSAAEYQAGHIRNSVNIPFEVPLSAWITVRNDLLLELPDTASLFTTLGSFGITQSSQVVIVSATGQPPYPLAGATRVADTLLYAGMSAVSILDGGYPKWVSEKKPTTTDVPSVTPVTYQGRVRDAAFVDIEHVRAMLGKSVLVDARDAAVYAGDVIEDWAPTPGHIPSAISLPAALIWNADGTYKSAKQLKVIAKAAVGADKEKPIIVYCGVGGYASSWLYVLDQILGYKNVKMYDGSAQEWVRHYDMEM